MKKGIYLVLTILISLFVFSNKVEAIHMYLECEYNSDCYEHEYHPLGRECLTNLTYYVPLTDKNGNVSIYSLKNRDIAVTNDDYYKLDDCWFEKYANKECSSKKTPKLDYKPSSILHDGLCPSGVLDNAGGKIVTPFGIGGRVLSKSEPLSETKYVIYSFLDKNGEQRLIAEGYTEQGKYCFASSKLTRNFLTTGLWSELDAVELYIYDKAHKMGIEFWKVHTNFNALMISTENYNLSLDEINVCVGMSQTDCAKSVKDGGHDYKVIIDSEDSNGNIKNAVESWYKEVENSEELKKLTELLDKDDFVQTATKFNSAMKNGKKYTFSSNYTIEQFINDLNDAYIVINSAYGEDKVIKDCVTGKGTSPSSSIVSCIYKNNLNISQIADIAEKDDKEHHVNIGHIVTAIKRDVQEELESYLNKNNRPINILNVTESILDYMEVFYTSVAYLDKNSSDYPLNSLQVSKIESLKKDYQKFVDENELGFYPVVDCESLLGEQLIEKINDYLNIFKIAIPILLIGFSILDFTKAIFASDEEKIKKTKDIFIKRIFISILIFLSPLLVNLILNIANRVWSFISPNACGLFK